MQFFGLILPRCLKNIDKSFTYYFLQMWLNWNLSTKFLMGSQTLFKVRCHIKFLAKTVFLLFEFLKWNCIAAHWNTQDDQSKTLKRNSKELTLTKSVKVLHLIGLKILRAIMSGTMNDKLSCVVHEELINVCLFHWQIQKAINNIELSTYLH